MTGDRDSDSIDEPTFEESLLKAMTEPITGDGDLENAALLPYVVRVRPDLMRGVTYNLDKDWF